ncbi:MAG: CHAT domain-containing protein [Bacteroidota bacterium]
MTDTLKFLEYFNCDEVEQSIQIVRANPSLLEEVEMLHFVCSGSPEKQYKIYELEDIRNLLLNEEGLVIAVEGNDLRGEFYFRDNIANVYARLSLHERSIRALKDFLMRAELFGEQAYQANLLTRIGSSYWSMGDLRNAKKYLETAQELNLTLDSIVVRGNIIQSLFAIYTGEGRHIDALNLLKEIEKINDHLHPPVWHIASTYESFGLAYKELGDFQKSLFYFKKGLEALRHAESWDRNSILMTAGLHGNIAVIYTYLGNFSKAYEHVMQNLICADQLQDKIGIIAAYGQMGVIYSKSKSYEQAANTKLDMLKLAEGERHPGWAGIACDNLALIYKNLQQDKAAFAYFKKSLDHKISSGAFGLESCWTFCYLLDQANTSRSCLLASYYFIEKIREAIRLSLPVALVRRWISPIEYLIEKSITDSDGSNYQPRLSFQATARSIIDKHGENVKTVLSVLAGELDFAVNEFEAMDSNEIGFHLLESMKAQSYLEQLAINNVRLDDFTNSPALVQRKKGITQRIIELQNQIQKSKTIRFPEKTYQLKEELKDILEERTLVDKQINQANPLISALKNDRPPTVAEVQESLEEDEIFLEYLLTDSKGKRFAIDEEYWYAFNEFSSGKAFVFYIDKKSFCTFEIGRTEKIANLANTLIGLIEDQAYEEFKDNAPEFQNIAHELHNILLKQPIAANQGRKKTLIIAPDGVLNFIPFDLLVVENCVNCSSFSALSYINQNYNVNYVQSARLFVESRKNELRDRKSENLITLVANDSFQTLGNLPSTLQEIAAIKRYFEETKTFQVNLLINQKDNPLSKDNILNSEIFSRSRILHFSCHAITDSENYPNGALVLNDNNPASNDVITAHEIMDIRTDATLVVLSACQTAVGSFERGEGIDSLVRAWNCAGALSIVATLWSVSDAASSNFMSEFYAYLTKGSSIREALREAKLSISKQPQFSYPYYWASFSAYGDCRSST